LGIGHWALGIVSLKFFLLPSSFFLLPSSYNSQNLFVMYELPEIRLIVERAAVINAIVGFANAIDAKDWDKLR
jgi:hypothetical protein